MKQLASRTTGVSFSINRQKWQATITIAGKLKYLGSFDTKEEACLVYDAAVDMYLAPGKRKNYIEVPEAPPGARYMPTTQGLFFLIDEEDYEEVSRHKWSARSRKENRSKFYILRTDDKNNILLHDFIMKDKLIDHIDGNTLDNRRSNLRKATSQQNVRNKAKTTRPCTSQYKGVCLEKKKWTASIGIDRKRKIRIGWFSDEKQAALAYNEAAKIVFKEFAQLNEVDAEITEETLAKVHMKLKGVVSICALIP